MAPSAEKIQGSSWATESSDGSASRSPARCPRYGARWPTRVGTVGYTNTKFVDGNPSPNTVVFFSPGHDADALALTQLLSLTDDRAQPLPAQTPLKEAVPTAALTVLVGADFDPATAPFTTTTVGPTN